MAVAGSLVVGMTVVLAGASPAMAASGGTASQPVPGLLANCPPGTPPAGKGVSSQFATAAGFTMTAGGNCTPGAASATDTNATNGTVTFSAIQATCTVDPFTETSQVIVRSGLAGAGIPNGSVIRQFLTVTFGGNTYIFNQPVANGVIALQINGVPLAEVTCGASYPLPLAVLKPAAQTNSASLGNAQSARSSRGLGDPTSSSTSTVLLLAGLVSAFIAINVLTVRRFRHR